MRAAIDHAKAISTGGGMSQKRTKRGAKRKPKPACGDSDSEVVRKANELAREFYASFGYTVPKGYRFDRATHPQERGMWNLAAIAYDFLAATDIEDALVNSEDEQ